MSSVHEANSKGNLVFPSPCFLVKEQGYAHPGRVSMSAQTRILYTVEIKSLTVNKPQCRRSKTVIYDGM